MYDAAEFGFDSYQLATPAGPSGLSQSFFAAQIANCKLPTVNFIKGLIEIEFFKRNVWIYLAVKATFFPSLIMATN